MGDALLESPALLVALRPAASAAMLGGLLVGLAAGLLLLPARPAGGYVVERVARRRGAGRGPARRRRRLRPASARDASSAMAGVAADVASGDGPEAAPGEAPDAALLVDLVSALLAAGSGIEASLDRLARTVPGAEPLSAVHRALAAGAGWDEAWAELRRGRAGGGLGALLSRLPGRREETDPRLRPLCDLGEQLTFAHGTGAPSTELLQIGAVRLRSARRHAAERQVARLGVRMVLPLGICFLPAFILLGVIPVVLGLLPQVIDGALGG